jgi:Spy/CpxP family protein refolding chaperone
MKGTRMNKHRMVKQMAVAAGFVFLCAAPRLTPGQTSPSSPAKAPQTASPATQSEKDASGTDPFAGMEFTAEQRAKIRLIHKDFKSRRETVIKDAELDDDKKQAFLDGLKRQENGEVLKVLTPEQQKEARNRELARRQKVKAAERNQMPPTQ